MTRKTTERRHHEAASSIELINISKSFGPVKANKDISMRISQGTIHGIIGENGAGKSTLMSILYGFYKADKGKILVNGKPVNITDPNAAIASGIGMVFQHFKLVENFTVLENVILGVEDGPLLRSSILNARKNLQALATEYELNVDPDATIESLGVGIRQRVEILKALYRKAKILILDEPTGVLTPAEADHLFRILKNLKEEGKTIIFITHKLREIMEITDTVSVMRQGEMTATVNTKDTNPSNLAELMVGRKVLLRIDKKTRNPGKTILEVQSLNVVDKDGINRLYNINLSVKAGEILGIAGVSGNGQSELLEVLGGITEATGSIKINGLQLPLNGKNVNGQYRRINNIAHVPEDRQHLGLVMEFKAWENIALGYHNDKKYQHNYILMDNETIKKDASEKMGQFDVRPNDTGLITKGFSGGNQQKLVLSREIERNPDLLLVGQPTRGVDIGAIEFIHQQLIKLRDAGKAILLVSVELDEIISLSDRIMVMFDGKIMGERLPSNTNEKELGLLMAGISGKNE